MCRRIAPAFATIVLLSGCTSVVDRPADTPTAAPDSQHDLQERMAACMGQEGWNGTKLDNGVYDYTYTEEQRSAFEAASAGCLDRIGANLPIDRTQAEWQDLYDFYLDTRDCLIANGVDLPSAPSFSVWQESDHTWTPYETVRPDELGTERFLSLTQSCPQTPSG